MVFDVCFCPRSTFFATGLQETFVALVFFQTPPNKNGLPYAKVLEPLRAGVWQSHRQREIVLLKRQVQIFGIAFLNLRSRLFLVRRARDGAPCISGFFFLVLVARRARVPCILRGSSRAMA